MALTLDNLKSYDDIKHLISPFDCILMRGGDLISDVIDVLEKYQLSMNTFTHIGMVVTSDILPKCVVNKHEFVLNPDKLYILESTFSYNVPGFVKGVNDVTTNKGKFGVQLRELEQIIPFYIHSQKTKVAWCRLLNNPYFNNKQLMQDKFISFFDNYHERKYEMDPLGLLAAIFTSFRGMRDVQDKMITKAWKKINKNANDKDIPIVNFQFCSELIANVYQCIGVLDERVNTKDVLPMDFFGDKIDHLDCLLDKPIYFKDWDIKNDKAIIYNL